MNQSKPQFTPDNLRVFVACLLLFAILITALAAVATPRARIDSTVKKNSGRKEATNPSLSTETALKPVVPICNPGKYSDGTSGNTPVTITNCTITNNSGDNDSRNSGNAERLFSIGGTTLTLRNSIVDLNFVGDSPGTTASDIAGTVVAASLVSGFCGEA